MTRVGQHAHTIKSPLVISGGASRAHLWNRIKADVLHHSVTVPENHNAGVLGAAMLVSRPT
jgi:sugar (pentulose or hexulose) kinase